MLTERDALVKQEQYRGLLQEAKIESRPPAAFGVAGIRRHGKTAPIRASG